MEEVKSVVNSTSSVCYLREFCLSFRCTLGEPEPHPLPPTCSFETHAPSPPSGRRVPPGLCTPQLPATQGALCTCKQMELTGWMQM